MRATGWSLDRVSDEIGTPVRVTDLERGLSAREQSAVEAGTDLGLQ
jgi:hypothetical protein